MLDLKQLEYFVVCTDVGSFSKAAEILYTTQSNISKSIKSLEKTLGFTLFIRHARGISLTFRGKYIYKYASKILEEMRALTEIAENDTEEWLHISFNPSSWFADRFVEFYNLHFHENFYCQIYETSVRKIMERVRDYSDDVGFVYVMENQKEAFQYSLDKNGLEFIPLKRIEAVMYFGKKHPLYTKKIWKIKILKICVLSSAIRTSSQKIITGTFKTVMEKNCRRWMYLLRQTVIILWNACCRRVRWSISVEVI